ncbi:filamentation protein-like protein [Periconia macrospinosa]|uniref:Filamentation protein-like protein n=1 Tax=Periconia macrospinosa TaxID=97972 RepID=A0A2V1ED85_9PLEO|nr:filamentation protein-like protein [Periconia macrospinosa]
MVIVSGSDKASRYIAQLDEARCAGRWNEVPELCRKVEKHASHRRCLTLTARSEAQIAAQSPQRPSTASSASSSSLANLIPPLQLAVDEEVDHAQDAFQATVCLGWIHYVLQEPGLAIARLPKDFAAVASKMQETSMSGWTRVCIVKGAFLKGWSQEDTGSLEDAVRTYRSVLPFLSDKLTSATPQFRAWTERLLVRLCLLSDQTSNTREYISSSEALQIFRYWALYWDSAAKAHGAASADGAKARRSAWKAYYDTLSDILRRGLPYEPESGSSNGSSEKHSISSSNRLLQHAELKKVETIYEGLLLKETLFPKASETNHEIVSWADSVMENWRFLCGSTWSNADLGAGGKEAVGRGVLDILYRAATKTFHSTQLLRYLFTVHASLADFDLAIKAYDSYVEIITRGKDRVEKTGEEDATIDDDGTVLMVSAEAIRLLCRYGSMKEAEKAIQISLHIEKWLEQSEHIRSSKSEAGSVNSIEMLIEPRALASAYAAMGISQAQWARYTYEADARASLQAKAEQYLRRSLEPSLQDSKNIDVLYALALVLAEKRDIATAIKVAKTTLSEETKQKTSVNIGGRISAGPAVEFGRERKLIPVWHLLALLLSAKEEDYAAAQKACEAAFEQFGDPSILFGEEEDNSYRSEHLKEIDGQNRANSGIIDQMESFEKMGILHVKMTQLSLLEEIEGVSVAVDGCDELLALHARLFGDTSAETSSLPVPAPAPSTMAPPKTAVGSSIRGSILRGRSSVRSAQKLTPSTDPTVTGPHESNLSGQPITAPSIQVTDEDGSHNNHNHHHLFHHSKNSDGQPGVQRSSSKLQKRSASSLRRKSQMDAEQAPDVPQLPEGINTNTPTQNTTGSTGHTRQTSLSGSTRKSIENLDRPLRPIPHNMPPTSQPPPSGHKDQPPKQDTRLPGPFPNASHVTPDPYFSRIQARRQKVAMLVSIWIFISGLYSRAKKFENAKDAAKEAFDLVGLFESEITRDSCSSKALAEKGWGGGKSVEELWADVFATRGQLLLAQELKHEARAEFERALQHFPDHPVAIVGLSDILLDIYCEVIPLEKGSKNLKKTFAETQHRLAARDRAFGLLSTLTKLGSGWDFSEAWYALSRAYEESGEIERAKKALWWVVELEDAHPIRDWDNATVGGFVL